MNNIILSICIPTFNRIEKLLPLINSILSYEGNDIEIVVIDNCSNDDTKKEMVKLQDHRINYIHRSHSVDGIYNIVTSLTYGKGIYSLLCLDKDVINSSQIQGFIQRLNQYNAVGGHCLLNTSKLGRDHIYSVGVESVINFAYTSEHPSGLFIKSSVLKQNNKITNIIEKHSSFPFLPELIKAQIALSGTVVRINMPFVFTETLEDCGKNVSFTYKGKNVYFFPENIINRFNIYCDNLFSLNLCRNDKIEILKKIYKSLLIASTLDFKKIMKNKSICSHHGIMTRDVSIKEIINYHFSFNKNFLNKDMPIHIIHKTFLIGKMNFSIIFRKVLKTIQ